MAVPTNSSLLNSLQRPRFLCDANFTKLVTSSDFTIKSLRSRNPSVKALGQGAFGATVSAEISLEPAGILLNEGFPGIVGNNSRNDLSCTTALKISLLASDIPSYGIPGDTLVETSVYSRTLQKENVAKALFVKVSPTEIKTVMEHYITNLSELVKKVGPFKRNLLRAVFFQLANGLHEFHQTDILHKDLKLQNVLLGHDGRIFITDFGLSNYMVVDSAQPKLFYRRDTTPTIQPPESFPYVPIGKPYDIWGLGVCLANLAYRNGTGREMYDFYASRYPAGKWEDEFSIKAIANMAWVNTQYSIKTEEIVRAVNLIDPQCGDLLRHILVNEPSQRYTTAQILAHPWFAGLTNAQAVRITQDELGMNPKMSRTILSIFDDIKQYDPATRTYTTNAPNVNTGTKDFFQIKPTSRNLLQVHIGNLMSQQVKANKFNEIFDDMILPGNVTIYTFLHAIEIFERFNFISSNVDPGNVSNTLYTCIMIATKLSPFFSEVTFTIEDLAIIKGRSSDRDYKKMILKREIEIIKTLRGDLFPLPNGFVSLFLNVYMKKRYSDPNKKIYRFLVGLLCFICWDGTVGTLQDVFHTADVIIVESGEVGAGIAGSEPNSKGPHSISTELKENIKQVISQYVTIWPMNLLKILNYLNPNIKTVLKFPYRNGGNESMPPPPRFTQFISSL